MDGVGFTAAREPQRHAIRDPAQNPAAVIGDCADLSVSDAEAVVVLAAAQPRRAEPFAELHALHRRDAEYDRRDTVFPSRRTSGRQDPPAVRTPPPQSIPPTESPSAFAAAMASRIFVPCASSTTGNFFSAVEAVSSPRSSTPAMAAMREIISMPLAPQQLQTDAARDAERRGQPPGKCPPPAASCAPPYLTAAV